MPKRKCACCGYYTLISEQPGSYEFCPVCYWTDDPRQRQNHDLVVSPNSLSLNEARKNFRKYGAYTEYCKQFVRPPKDDEYSGIDD